MFDPDRADLRLGIVGAGLMGRGVAQIAAQAGVAVRLHDLRPGAAGEAREGIRQQLDALAKKGKIEQRRADEAVARIEVVNGLEAFAGSHVVIEAIVEDLAAKRTLFESLERIVDEGCVIATNTSSLSVTAIAAACRRPGRIAGFHFFSPVPLMKIVEVIEGVRTAPGVADALAGLARRMGHLPVRASDTPGFLVNHAGRGYGTEALRIVGEGIAGFHDVDRVLKEACGFRMGPFELLDLTGLDVSHPVMESIYDQFYQEPRFRPSPITRQRLAGGLLGRKSGEGFYVYREGRIEQPPAPVAPPPRACRVWIEGSAGAAYAATSAPIAPATAAPIAAATPAAIGAARAAIVSSAAAAGATVEEAAGPSNDAICIVLPIGRDTTTTSVAHRLDPTRTVALDPLFLSGRRTLMTNPLTSVATRDAAHGLLAADGAAVTVIRDSPGFIAQRVVATIVNIACDIAQQRIAAPADIDRAVTLGLGYPRGPLAMGDALGAGTVLAILDAMHEFYGDPRYRASPWLRRRATLGVSLLTAEA